MVLAAAENARMDSSSSVDDSAATPPLCDARSADCTANEQCFSSICTSIHCSLCCNVSPESSTRGWWASILAAVVARALHFNRCHHGLRTPVASAPSSCQYLRDHEASSVCIASASDTTSAQSLADKTADTSAPAQRRTTRAWKGMSNGTGCETSTSAKWACLSCSATDCAGHTIWPSGKRNERASAMVSRCLPTAVHRFGVWLCVRFVWL